MTEVRALMRIFRICGCGFWLLTLMGIVGCDCKEVVQTAYPKKDCIVKINDSGGKCTVTVSTNCDTDSNDNQSLLVHINDTVAWKATTDHLIQFPPSLSFRDGKTPLKRAGTPLPSVSSGDPAATVKGDNLCPDGHPTYDRDCYYKYNVIQVEANNTCSDPGVRVVPNGNLGLLRAIWLCVKYHLHLT